MLAIPHRYASKQEYLQSRSLEPLLLRSPKKDDPTSRKERVNMNQLRTAGCHQPIGLWHHSCRHGQQPQVIWKHCWRSLYAEGSL